MKAEEEELRGKIKSVAVKDFVTYDRTIFFPGDNLNIIIGPNGTGKSTLVAGIVLGMGGNCKLLSRSTSITDYIKNGKETAKIEVHIYKNNEGETTIFNRTFNQSGKETFLVDGKSTSHREYLRRIKDFNIQIDNLCQFLPQDRVQDFAKMNPQEILKNTQSSVCDADVAEMFDQLIEKRQKQLESQKRSTDIMTKLREAEQRNEELKGAIENMKERQSYTKKLNMCTKKKLWMEYEIGYEKYRETEKDLNTAKLETAKANDKLKPLQDSIDALKRAKDNLEKAVKQAANHERSFGAKLDEADEGLERFEAQIKTAKSELQDAMTQVRDRESEIRDARRFLAVLLEDLKRANTNTGSASERTEKQRACKSTVEKLKRDMDHLHSERQVICSQLDETVKPQMMNLERRIKNMENVKQRRLEFLQQHHEDTYKAVLWLRDNLHEFKGKVYEPMMMELNVRNADHVKYLENAVNNRDLIAFTCERKEDMAVFMQKIRSDLRLNANVVHSPHSDKLMFAPTLPIQQIRKYGFSNYLIDVVEGPVAILNILCQLFGIHNIPFGNDDVYNKASQVPNEIRSFYSTNHMFRVNISRYSGQKSTSSFEVKTKNYLTQNIDINLLEQTKAGYAKFVRQSDALRNERTAMENQLTEIQQKLHVAHAEHKKIEESQRNLQHCAEKVQRQQVKVETLEKSVINVDTEKAKFKAKVKRITESLLKAHTERAKHTETFRKACAKTEIARAKLDVFQNNNTDTGSELRQLQDDLKKAKILEERIAACVEQTKADCKKLLSEAKKGTENMTPNNENFPYKKQFAALPGDLEELQSRIDEIQNRLDLMGTEDLSIIEDYKRRCAQIAEMREQIAAGTTWLEKIEIEIQQMHIVWYEKITAVVEVINENFSNFMSTMGFAGEVSLSRSDERSYKDYGITIGVKYRNNERLQTLDRYVQSGGERAVAIAVYTLSLQHISHVPFRCVDEINQGMDPRNERKIFDMLVDQTCRKGRSQYFFITPKLLPNLACNDLMTVHIVHNGKFIENPHMFVMDKLTA